jgi:hypothetical protein
VHGTTSTVQIVDEAAAVHDQDGVARQP